jgi:hypothetical protein
MTQIDIRCTCINYAFRSDRIHCAFAPVDFLAFLKYGNLPHNEIVPVDSQPLLACLHFFNEFPWRNEIFNIEWK